MKTIDYRKIIVEACRIILGATFLFSGVVKSIDPVGGALKMEDYFGAFGLSFLNPVALITSIHLSALEFIMGVCILAAVYRKLTTICVLAFMSFMTLLTLYLAIFNPVHDCGCFGDAIILTNWQTFFKNLLVLLPASAATYFYRKKMTQLYTQKVHWFVLLFAYIYSVGFAFYNYENLPVINFRPYKIGANIPQLMAIPDDAPQDEYVLIYEKDGKRQNFTAENTPDDDSGWTFVEIKITKPGYVPPIASFVLYNADGDDVTDKILTETRGVFLLVSPYLEKASDKDVDEINSLYDCAVERGVPFYCATASTPENIKDWINNTGAEYPFLTADDVTLKTMIRSNPGLIFLRSGTILAKWHHNDIPPEEAANAVIDKLTSESSAPADTQNTNIWRLIILYFILPLSLVWIYDFLTKPKKMIQNK